MKKIISLILVVVVLSNRLVAETVSVPTWESPSGLSENEQVKVLREMGALKEQMQQLVKEIVQYKNRMEEISTLSLFWGQRPKVGNEVEYNDLAKKVAEDKEKLRLLNQSYLKLGRITGHTFDPMGYIIGMPVYSLLYLNDLISRGALTDAIRKKTQSYYDSVKNYLGYK